MMEIVVDGPGDLLATIPGMMGFVPEESVVVIALQDRRNVFTARMDITDDTGDYDLHALFAQLAECSVDAIILVEISEEHHATATDLSGQIGTKCAINGILVLNWLCTRNLNPGSEWFDVDKLTRGTVSDYKSSTLSAALVAQGRVIHRSREGIRGQFEPGSGPKLRGTEGPVDPKRVMEVVRALDGRASDELARDVIAVADSPAIRDALIKIRDIEKFGQIAAIYADIAGRTEGHARISLLTLSGLLSYALGDGATADVAFDVAKEEPGSEQHRLLHLLRYGLNNGMHPDAVRALTREEE